MKQKAHWLITVPVATRSGIAERLTEAGIEPTHAHVEAAVSFVRAEAQAAADNALDAIWQTFDDGVLPPRLRGKRNEREAP